jgi:hypothetical protein
MPRHITVIFSSVPRCASLRYRDRFLLLLEAGATEDGAALSGPERDGRFRSTLRAGRPRLRAHSLRPSSTFGLALLAVLRVIFELLVVKEYLLAGREDELGAAVHTLQYSIGEFHGGRLPPNRDPHRNRPKSWNAPFPVPCSRSCCALGPGPLTRAALASQISQRQGKMQTKRGVLSSVSAKCSIGGRCLHRHFRFLGCACSG